MQYDSSDRITSFTDNGTAGASIYMDPDNRVYYEGQEQNYNVYADDTDTPAAAFGNTVHITERYVQLPGGVTATIRNVTGSPAVTNTLYSLPDVQGNIFGTTTGTGQLSTIDEYDAFGQKLGSGAPEDTTSSDYFGDHGESGILTDGFSANQFTFMGARLYIPTIGRFAQTDPIEDGNANAYVYPADPINNTDISGDISWGTIGNIAMVGALFIPGVGEVDAGFEAADLLEQLAMDEVRADPEIGVDITEKIGIRDPEFAPEKGWAKMQHIHEPLDPEKPKINVHYFYRESTGEIRQLKIKY